MGLSPIEIPNCNSKNRYNPIKAFTASLKSSPLWPILSLRSDLASIILTIRISTLKVNSLLLIIGVNWAWMWERVSKPMLPLAICCAIVLYKWIIFSTIWCMHHTHNCNIASLAPLIIRSCAKAAKEKTSVKPRVEFSVVTVTVVVDNILKFLFYILSSSVSRISYDSLKCLFSKKGKRDLLYWQIVMCFYVKHIKKVFYGPKKLC